MSSDVPALVKHEERFEGTGLWQFMQLLVLYSLPSWKKNAQDQMQQERVAVSVFRLLNSFCS